MGGQSSCGYRRLYALPEDISLNEVIINTEKNLQKLDATSALDDATERKVMESIDKLGNDITVFMIAHRVSTLSGCDQVIELVEGKVSRVGSYRQLINNAGGDV